MTPAPIGAKLPIRSAVQVVRTLFELIDASGMSYRKVGKLAGVNPVSLSQWRQGVSSPTVQSLENVLQVLGYRIEIKQVPPIEDGAGQSEDG